MILRVFAAEMLRIVKNKAPLIRYNVKVVFVGGGVKQAKEARRMPAVKKLHQESENNSKVSYIFGYLFGVVGYFDGNPTERLLSASIH